jgi:hypothetical protein
MRQSATTKHSIIDAFGKRGRKMKRSRHKAKKSLVPRDWAFVIKLSRLLACSE